MVIPREDDLIRRFHDLRQAWRGDWVGTVLVVLRRGRTQFSALRDELAGYTFVDPWSGRQRALHSSDLSRTLTRMTEDGLLIRTETPGQWHATVFYELSDGARQWLEAAAPLLEWAGGSREFFARAQRRRQRHSCHAKA